MQELFRNKTLKYLTIVLFSLILLFSFTVSTALAYTLGDVNNDGRVDVQDVALITRHVLGVETLSTVQIEVADVNGDGMVNVQDITIITQISLGLNVDLFDPPEHASESDPEPAPEPLLEQKVEQEPTLEPEQEQNVDQEPAPEPAPLLLPATTLYLVADDGTYLGKLTTNKFDPDGVFNEFGTYGSKFSYYSIWNQFGTYGSKYSSLSAFNDYAFAPPYIVTSDGRIVGRLTTNRFIYNAVSPYALYPILLELGL